MKRLLVIVMVAAMLAVPMTATAKPIVPRIKGRQSAIYVRYDSTSARVIRDKGFSNAGAALVSPGNIFIMFDRISAPTGVTIDGAVCDIHFTMGMVWINAHVDPSKKGTIRIYNPR